MRAVRNTVDTGRTVVCTIHQPSIDIFEAFDELLLMKRGGQVVYAGPLGDHSSQLIEYFEVRPGVCLYSFPRPAFGVGGPRDQQLRG
jgi:ABC-type multidrug transport system ATPase subunit